MKGIVSFYGKSGCSGNRRQVEQLKQADYVVQWIDILKKRWDEETLSKFLGHQAVHNCINQRAPTIISGETNPNEMDDDQLMQAMVEDPVLIKRPLLFYRGEFACGFDHPLVGRLLGEEISGDSCRKNRDCAHSD